MRAPTSPTTKAALAALSAALFWAAADVASAASWTAAQDYEQVSNAAVGSGVTAWSVAANVSVDTGTGNAAGDPAGTADVAVASALYGGFSAAGVELSLITAPAGCGGTWAAAFSGAQLTGDKDAHGNALWSDGWKIDGTNSYVCIQDAGTDKRVVLNLLPSATLGALWGAGAAAGTEALADKVAGFRWTGLVQVAGSGGDLAGWQAAAAAQGGDTGMGSGSYVAVGGSPKAQLRDRVRRNVQAVTAGLAAATDAPTGLAGLTDTDLLNAPAYHAENGVLFYDFTGKPDAAGIGGNKGQTLVVGGKNDCGDNGNATYCSKISGPKTVIVKGGNLRISSDLYYADPDSLVVFVVLKDETDPANGGDVYVDPGVTNLVGTFVADGSLLDYGGNKILSSGQPGDRNSLRRQLLLYGSLASANTVGGSKGTPACPYGSDAERQGLPCTSAEAAKYDLAAFRTFYLGVSRKPDGMGVTTGAPTDGNACSTGTGGTSYETPRWSQKTSTWDAQPYAWAGKSKCYKPVGTNDSIPNNEPATNLRPAPDSAFRAAFVAEFNPLAARADLPILRDPGANP